MDPLSTACVPEAEVIDLESAECRSGATMAKSMGHSSGFHPKQQGHRKISLSPQSKALKVSGTRGSLNKTAARVVSRCQPKCVVNIIKEFDDRKKELIGEVGFDGLLDIKLTKYNWSQFVVDEVKKAAESMPTCFPNKAQLSINGCIIFLMVKYLRNLQFRKVGITCVKTCHISQFEDDQIARMIQQDVVSKHNPGFPFPRYGKLQLMKEPRENNPHVPELSPLNLCSGSKIPSRAIDGGKNLIKFLESHFSSLDVRGTVGSQAYEELKSYIQDGFDRIDEILPTISDFVDISTMQTAIHTSNLFKRAFKTNITAAVKIAIRAAVTKVIDTIEDIQGPLHPWGDTTAMGYHTPTNYSTHATKDASQLDQPTDTQQYDHKIGGLQCTPPKSNGAPEFGSDGQKKRKYTVENPPSHLLKHKSKRVVKPNRKLMSPFMSKQCSTERLESRIADDLYSYIMSISDDASLEKTWLQSSHPFRISLTLRNIQETIKIGSQMDSDSLNLAIRIMFQQEVERFHNTNYLGWRHFINQDFGMYALAGEEFWEASHQLAHFSGPEVVYDVSESHLILIPVHLFNHYVLYVFNMESKKLSVLDSLNTEDPLGESRFTRHDKIKIMVSQCVMECMRLASPGWNMDILNWDFETVENIPEQQNRDDCGFYVFNFMVNYDGRRLLNPITEDPYYLRRQFLIHLLTLRDNEAILPEYVVDRLRQIKDN
uniref:OSJNBa0063C18.6 protein n=1 Tax=Oryza sativa subsp. japonica TaxID=39947 RepID=Q7X6Q9_ORYSJ|nr:OSJNBb0079B02.11 [Oryza sativa Japonica Group]CAE05965.2 OSJNBa0063C18.6 [Oryza sativa Japonica Group]